MKLKISALVLAGAMTLPATCKGDYGCDSCNNYFDGFYLGVAGAVATNLVDHKVGTFIETEIRDQAGALLDTQTFTSEVSTRAYQIKPWGEIYGGYGFEWNCGGCWGAYLGGRLGVNFSRFNVKTTNDFSFANDSDNNNEDSLLVGSTRLTTKLRNAEFTFDLKPGIVFCQRSMLFGIIGGAVNQAKLSGESTIAFSTFAPPATVISVKNNSRSKNIVGFRIGLGLEQFITQCVSLQLSYVYTRYRDLKYYGNASVPLITEHETAFKVRASKEVYSLGLSYYF